MKYVPKYSIKEESCDSKKDEPIKKVNINPKAKPKDCLLYTSDAADE